MTDEGWIDFTKPVGDVHSKLSANQSSQLFPITRRGCIEPLVAWSIPQGH